MKATPAVAEFDPVRRDGGPDNSIRTRGLTRPSAHRLRSRTLTSTSAGVGSFVFSLPSDDG